MNRAEDIRKKMLERSEIVNLLFSTDDREDNFMQDAFLQVKKQNELLASERTDLEEKLKAYESFNKAFYEKYEVAMLHLKLVYENLIEKEKQMKGISDDLTRRRFNDACYNSRNEISSDQPNSLNSLSKLPTTAFKNSRLKQKEYLKTVSERSLKTAANLNDRQKLEYVQDMLTELLKIE